MVLRVSYDCGMSLCGTHCDTCRDHSDSQICDDAQEKIAALVSELEKLTGKKRIEQLEKKEG